MFWLIDSCKNSVSADQYRLTVSRAQLSTHWVRVFFWSYLLTSCYFSNDRRLKFIFFKCIWNKSCSWAALLKFWFRPDLGRENSPGFYMQGRQSLLTFLPVTRWSRSTCKFYVLIGQNLTGEFMRKIYAASGNLFTEAGQKNRWLVKKNSTESMRLCLPLTICRCSWFKRMHPIHTEGTGYHP